MYIKTWNKHRTTNQQQHTCNRRIKTDNSLSHLREFKCILLVHIFALNYVAVKKLK